MELPCEAERKNRIYKDSYDKKSIKKDTLSYEFAMNDTEKIEEINKYAKLKSFSFGTNSYSSKNLIFDNYEVKQNQDIFNNNFLVNNNFVNNKRSSTKRVENIAKQIGRMKIFSGMKISSSKEVLNFSNVAKKFSFSNNFFSKKSLDHSMLEKGIKTKNSSKNNSKNNSKTNLNDYKGRNINNIKVDSEKNSTQTLNEFDSEKSINLSESKECISQIKTNSDENINNEKNENLIIENSLEYKTNDTAEEEKKLEKSEIESPRKKNWISILKEKNAKKKDLKNNGVIKNDDNEGKMDSNDSAYKKVFQRNLGKTFNFLNFDDNIKKDVYLNDVIKVLKKQNRDPKEIDFIKDYLKNNKEIKNIFNPTSNTNVYQNRDKDSIYERNRRYENDMIIKISKNLSYENCSKDNIICKYGDKADKFYIILKGLVSILIPKEETRLITLTDYFFYLCLLSFYEEYELIKNLYLMNNEELSYNFPFPVEIFLSQNSLNKTQQNVIGLSTNQNNLTYNKDDDFGIKKGNNYIKRIINLNKANSTTNGIEFDNALKNLSNKIIKDSADSKSYNKYTSSIQKSNLKTNEKIKVQDFYNYSSEAVINNLESNSKNTSDFNPKTNDYRKRFTIMPPIDLVKEENDSESSSKKDLNFSRSNSKKSKLSKVSSYSNSSKELNKRNNSVVKYNIPKKVSFNIETNEEINSINNSVLGNKMRKSIKGVGFLGTMLLKKKTITQLSNKTDNLSNFNIGNSIKNNILNSQFNENEIEENNYNSELIRPKKNKTSTFGPNSNMKLNLHSLKSISLISKDSINNVIESPISKNEIDIINKNNEAEEVLEENHENKFCNNRHLLFLKFYIGKIILSIAHKVTPEEYINRIYFNINENILERHSSLKMFIKDTIIPNIDIYKLMKYGNNPILFNNIEKFSSTIAEHLDENNIDEKLLVKNDENKKHNSTSIIKNEEDKNIKNLKFSSKQLINIGKVGSFVSNSRMNNRIADQRNSKKRSALLFSDDKEKKMSKFEQMLNKNDNRFSKDFVKTPTIGSFLNTNTEKSLINMLSKSSTIQSAEEVNDNKNVKIIKDVKIEKKFTLKIYKYLEVTFLKTGQKFGDVAFLLNQKRTATVLAVDETDLATLNKASYVKLMKEFNEQLLKNNIQVIISSFLFQNVSIKRLKTNFINFFVHEIVQRNSVLIEENKESKFYYIVKKGHLELSLNRSLFEYDQIISKLGGKISEYDIKLKLSKIFRDNYFYNLIKKTICTLGHSELIGLEDMTVSIKCMINNENELISILKEVDWSKIYYDENLKQCSKCLNYLKKNSSSLKKTNLSNNLNCKEKNCINNNSSNFSTYEEFGGNLSYINSSFVDGRVNILKCDISHYEMVSDNLSKENNDNNLLKYIEKDFKNLNKSKKILI